MRSGYPEFWGSSSVGALERWSTAFRLLFSTQAKASTPTTQAKAWTPTSAELFGPRMRLTVAGG